MNQETIFAFEEAMEELQDVVDKLKRVLHNAPNMIEERAISYWLGYLEDMALMEDESRAIMVMPWQTLAELKEAASGKEEEN